MASMRERAGSWNVYWRRGGRGGKTESTTWPDPKYAERAKKIAEAHGHQITASDVESIILGDTGEDEHTTPTLTEWASRWLDSRTRIDKGTRSTYRGQLDREILPVLGEKQLHEITGEDIARLLASLQARFANTTVTRYYAVLHAMLKFAVREKLIDDNPASRTDFVRDIVAGDDAGDDDDHVYMSWPEIQLIIQAAAPDARPLLRFLAGTGARFSEATAVAVGSVDVLSDRKTVWIRRAWKHNRGSWELGPTKGRNKRCVDMDGGLVDALIPLVASEPGDAYLFRAPEGGPVRYRNFESRRWRPAVIAAMRCPAHPPQRRGTPTSAARLAGPLCGDNGGTRDDGAPCGRGVLAGLNRCWTHDGPADDAVSTCDCPTRLRKRPTLHDLRHSHVAQLIAKNVPIAAISRRIGHRSTAITEQVYAGILPEVNEAIVLALDELVGRVSGDAAAKASAAR